MSLYVYSMFPNQPFPLAHMLLDFWASVDFRRQNMYKMKGATLEYVMKQITKRGKCVSDEIVKRQLKGIPAPDMFQGVEA